jgi:hypothetical protein
MVIQDHHYHRNLGAQQTPEREKGVESIGMIGLLSQQGAMPRGTTEREKGWESIRLL